MEFAEAGLRSLLEDMHGLSIYFSIVTANEKAAVQATSALEQSITDGTFQSQLARSGAYVAVEVSAFEVEVISNLNSVEESSQPPPLFTTSSPNGASHDNNMLIYISVAAGALLIAWVGVGGVWYRHRRCQVRKVIRLQHMSDEGASNDDTKVLGDDVEGCGEHHEIESVIHARRDAW